VAVIAPGSPVDVELLRAGVAILGSWGLEVEVLGHVVDTELAPFTHLAGSDLARRDDFVAAMTRPDIKAVFCARGGTGAGRTLEALTAQDWKSIAASTPRWFVGSSDATALHAAIAQHIGWATLFGPMPATATFTSTDEPTSALALYRALFAVNSPHVLAGRSLIPAPLVSASPVTAPLCGGTITVLASLIGTGDLPVASGRIVLLEDVNEAPRRLDRSLTQLRRSGWFDGALGVVVGSLIDCGTGAIDIVHQRLADLQVPVACDFTVGHGAPQLTLALGVPLTFDSMAATLTWST